MSTALKTESVPAAAAAIATTRATAYAHDEAADDCNVHTPYIDSIGYLEALNHCTLWSVPNAPVNPYLQTTSAMSPPQASTTTTTTKSATGVPLGMRSGLLPSDAYCLVELVVFGMAHLAQEHQQQHHHQGAENERSGGGEEGKNICDDGDESSSFFPYGGPDISWCMELTNQLALCNSRTPTVLSRWDEMAKLNKTQRARRGILHELELYANLQLYRPIPQKLLSGAPTLDDEALRILAWNASVPQCKQFAKMLTSERIADFMNFVARNGDVELFFEALVRTQKKRRGRRSAKKQQGVITAVSRRNNHPHAPSPQQGQGAVAPSSTQSPKRGYAMGVTSPLTAAPSSASTIPSEEAAQILFPTSTAPSSSAPNPGGKISSDGRHHDATKKKRTISTKSSNSKRDTSPPQEIVPQVLSRPTSPIATGSDWKTGSYSYTGFQKAEFERLETSTALQDEIFGTTPPPPPSTSQPISVLASSPLALGSSPSHVGGGGFGSSLDGGGGIGSSFGGGTSGSESDHGLAGGGGNAFSPTGGGAGPRVRVTTAASIQSKNWHTAGALLAPFYRPTTKDILRWMSTASANGHSKLLSLLLNVYGLPSLPNVKEGLLMDAAESGAVHLLAGLHALFPHIELHACLPLAMSLRKATLATTAAQNGHWRILEWLKDKMSVNLMAAVPRSPTTRAVAIAAGNQQGLPVNMPLPPITLAGGGAGGARPDDRALLSAAQKATNTLFILPHFAAARANQIAVLEWMYRGNLNLSLEDEDDRGMEHYAAEAGALESLGWMLSKGFDIWGRSDSAGNTVRSLLLGQSRRAWVKTASAAHIGGPTYVPNPNRFLAASELSTRKFEDGGENAADSAASSTTSAVPSVSTVAREFVAITTNKEALSWLEEKQEALKMLHAPLQRRKITGKVDDAHTALNRHDNYGRSNPFSPYNQGSSSKPSLTTPPNTAQQQEVWLSSSNGGNHHRDPSSLQGKIPVGDPSPSSSSAPSHRELSSFSSFNGGVIPTARVEATNSAAVNDDVGEVFES